MKVGSVAQVIATILILGLNAAGAESTRATPPDLSVKNINLLLSQPRTVLLKLRESLKKKSAEIAHYDDLFYGVEPQATLSEEKSFPGLTTLEILREEFEQASRDFESQLTAIESSCKNYFRSQARAIQEIIRNLPAGNPNLNLGNKTLAKRTSYQTYRYYFLSLGQTLVNGGGPYSSALRANYPCVASEVVRSKLASVAFRAARLIHQESTKRFGMPAYLKGDGLASQVADFNLKENAIARQYGKIALHAGVSIGGFYLGVGVLKSLFDIGRLGVLAYGAVYGGATSALGGWSKTSADIANQSSALESTSSPEASGALETLILESKKIKAEIWYEFLAITDSIQTEELLKSRSRINSLCENQRCSKEELKKLSEKTLRQIREVDHVLTDVR